MEYRIPKKGEIYRHFKGNLYEIIIIARDSETLEEKVVYKEADGEAVYVRSLPMFVSCVDKEKYPDVKQEFRFELVKGVAAKKAAVQESPSEKSEISETGMEQWEQKLIMDFLDLSSSNDKIHYLQSVRDRITDKFISIVANSLEFTENEGDLYERYMAVLRFLRTKAKYETERF